LLNRSDVYGDVHRLEEAEKYYLKAIEKGEVDALFNLALLYKKLNRLEEAEKYYLKAIEKGDVDALKYLAIFYWGINKKKDHAWDFIESYIKNTREKSIQDRLILLLIAAWAKKPFFEENKLPILEELTRYQPQLIDNYLLILYHDYSDYLIYEFEKGDLSDKLKTNYQLVYLVT